MNLSPRKNLVLHYLKKGFFIQVTQDIHTLEVEKVLTNGHDDLMSIKTTTLKALIKKGVVSDRGNESPCIGLIIQKYRLKIFLVGDAG